jgi:protoporphyrin/coproporphyrin ferrochelatase
MAKQAVLLVAHGTPDRVEQVAEYLRNVVSGRPVQQRVIEEIQRRYRLIGHSPLTEMTRAQARLVEAELAATGCAVPVYIGMRNWRPYIAEAVRQIRADGIEEAAVLCMAPQNSRTSVGLYRRAVEAEAGGLRIDFTEEWARHPLLADAFAERLRPAWSKLSAEVGQSAPVLFTAHSVPAITVEQGADPYAKDARATAALVAARVPEIPRWGFAFQSQGMSGGSWLGPTVEETLDRIAEEGARALIVQPIGFLCDHVEILYDVDIHFRAYAERLHLRLERPASLNESATLAKALAELARQSLKRMNR